ncbi:MAG: FAD-dependent oxidoreductase, partial [Actinomycetota bacterium]|nr:FAD-dependent oxidoreductase [Actinomycetota bacterium]
LSWDVSSCVQDATWSVVRESDSRMFPPADAEATLRAVYGDDVIRQWIAGFEQRVSLDGISTFTSWSDVAARTWSPTFEWEYRRLAGGLSSVNHVGVNHPMTREAIIDPRVRESTLIAVKDKAYLYIWWEHHVLGVNNGIATTQGFEGAIQMVDSPSIPNDVEQHFPPIPYVREARRLSNSVMTWEDIRVRGTVAEGSAFAWGNGTDSHGCPIPREQASSYGVFGVDPGVFVQDDVSGFYPAMARAARVDWIVASSVRMQPSEYAGGYAVGNLIVKALRTP